MPSLLVMRGVRFVRRIRIAEGEIRIGRSASNEICSSEPAGQQAACGAQLPRVLCGDQDVQHQRNLREWRAGRCHAGPRRRQVAAGRRRASLLPEGRSDRGARRSLRGRRRRPGCDEPGRPGGHRKRRRMPFRRFVHPRRRGGRCPSGKASPCSTRGREVPALITYDALATHFGAYAFGQDGRSRGWSTPSRRIMSRSTSRRPIGTRRCSRSR